MGNHFSVIFQKQIKDTIKNKAVLIQFIMFPMMTVIMTNTIKIEGMPKNFFVFLFAAMYAGMAPLVSAASIMAEEKEKGIVRVLQLMNVKQWEYLLGTGSYVVLLCMLCTAVFPGCGEYSIRQTVLFYGIMAVGIVISVLLGSAIGVAAAHQMAATSVVMPVMMLFSFLPMIGMFNETVAKIAKWTYTGQIQILLSGLGERGIELENAAVLGLNFLAALGVFYMAYGAAVRST